MLEMLNVPLARFAMPGPKHPRWSRDGALMQFGRVEGGKGTRVLCSYRDRDVPNVLGARGRNDVEKPVGEWNRLEAICDGGTVAFILNGVQVNGGHGCTYREGKILFQSEGAEIFWRRIELHPLK